MKVGDLVKFAETAAHHRGPTAAGIVTALSRSRRWPGDGDHHMASVLWSSGDLVERMNPAILEVIDESR